MKKIKMYLETKPSFNKYRSRRLRFPRLKVVVNDINEIWSVDLAYVDKLAKYNGGVKYLLVAVDCLSRYLRVCQDISSKGFEDEFTVHGISIASMETNFKKH